MKSKVVQPMMFDSILKSNIVYFSILQLHIVRHSIFQYLIVYLVVHYSFM